MFIKIRCVFFSISKRFSSPVSLCKILKEFAALLFLERQTTKKVFSLKFSKRTDLNQWIGCTKKIFSSNNCFLSQNVSFQWSIFWKFQIKTFIFDVSVLFRFPMEYQDKKYFLEFVCVFEKRWITRWTFNGVICYKLICFMSSLQL